MIDSKSVKEAVCAVVAVHNFLNIGSPPGVFGLGGYTDTAGDLFICLFSFITAPTRPFVRACGSYYL